MNPDGWTKQKNDDADDSKSRTLNHGYQYQYTFTNGTGVSSVVPLNPTDDSSASSGSGSVSGSGVGSGSGSPMLSPSLPDHIYVRQEGTPKQTEIYDASTGKHLDNVTDVEVTLNRNESRVRVVARDGERTYPVQDLTVDANGAKE